MNTSRILITGASGFVGSALALRLQEDEGIVIRKAYRSAPSDVDPEDSVIVGDIGPTTNWMAALEDVDTVIHCAARVHVMNDAGSFFR